MPPSPFSELVDPAQLARLREVAAGNAPASSAAPTTPPAGDRYEDASGGTVEVKDGTDGVAMEHKADDVGFGGTQVLEADDTTGVVVALVSVTGVEDRVKDVIEPGSYTETIANHEPIGVWSHDDKTWVARTEDAVELMPGDPFFADLKTMDGKPWPKEAGAVKVRSRFNLDTPHGAAAYSDVKFFQGKTGWSIGYRVKKATRNMRTGVRYIKSLDWFEYSPVMVGAASQPMTLSVKSLAAPVDPDDTTGLGVDALVDALDESDFARYDELKAGFGLETKSSIRHVRTAAGAARYGQPIGTVIRRDSVSAGSVSVGDQVEFTDSGDKVAGKVDAKTTDDDRVKLKVGGTTYDLPSARSIIKAVAVNAEARGDKRTAANASDADRKQQGKDQQAAFRKLAESGDVSGEARRNLLRMADRDDYDPTDKAQTQGAATALRMAAAQLDGDDKARAEAMAIAVQRGGDPAAGGDKPATMPAGGRRDPSAPVSKPSGDAGNLTPTPLDKAHATGLMQRTKEQDKLVSDDRTRLQNMTDAELDAEALKHGKALRATAYDSPERRIAQSRADSAYNEIVRRSDGPDATDAQFRGGKARRVAAAGFTEAGLQKEIDALKARYDDDSLNGSQRLDISSEMHDLERLLKDLKGGDPKQGYLDDEDDDEGGNDNAGSDKMPAGYSDLSDADKRKYHDLVDDEGDSPADAMRQVRAESTPLTAAEQRDKDDDDAFDRDDQVLKPLYDAMSGRPKKKPGLRQRRAAATTAKADEAQERRRGDDPSTLTADQRLRYEGLVAKGETFGAAFAKVNGWPSAYGGLSAPARAQFRARVKRGESPAAALAAVKGAFGTKALPTFIEKSKLAALNKRRKAEGKPPLPELPDGMKALPLDVLESLDEVFLEAKGSSASLNQSPKQNWVEKAGELPAYVREVARSIEGGGRSLSDAIPIAIGRIKRWAHGGGDVTAATIAKASKAVAEWEALKAKSHMKYDSELLAHLEWKAVAVLDAEDDAWGLLYETGALDDALGVKADVLLADDDLLDEADEDVLDADHVDGDGTDLALDDQLLGKAAELKSWLAGHTV